VIVVPLAILGGVFAALREGRFADRFISIAGLSATVVPEFVSSIILILIIGLWLELLPITAAWPPDAGPLTQLKHLILPSLPLVFVLFGYIARMARAGTIEALDADYTRTAVLKGLPQRTVIRRHVLRNALLPTIAVVATQTGYLVGGLVVIEVIFNYQGIGRLLFDAARAKDFPMLQSAVLVVGIVYLVATLLADLAYSLLNPRIRHAGT
jgi:peptide/nickel transport system permease protein